MANRYFDGNNGSSGNDGSTALLAKATVAQAESASTGGDKVIAVDGAQAHDASYFNFAANRVYSSESYRGATLQPFATEITYAARSSGSFSAANNPLVIENFVIDGLSQVTQAFEIGQDASEDTQIRVSGCHVLNGTQYGLLINHRRGRVELTNIKLSGAGAQPMLMTTASLSNDGNQVIDINGLELDGAVSSGSMTGLSLTKVNNVTNTLGLTLQGVTGTLTPTGSASAVGMNIKTVDPSITNCSFTIDATNTAGTGHFGILCQGQSVAIASNPIIANNNINFQVNAGYGLALGQSDFNANVTGGEVSGNTVTGYFDTLETPHGFLMGQGVAGATMRGNTAQTIYVGYLASKCTSGIIEGNLAYNCHGPSLYIKGCTDITVQDNIVVINIDTTAANDTGVGAISINEQTDGTNTAACSIRRNLVIVDDVSKVQSLAGIFLDQSASFENNTYIIPDTVDVSTEDLFAIGNSSIAANSANATLAEWNALSSTANGIGTVSVTGDKIVQLPLSEIQSMIAAYKPASRSGGGIVSSIISSIVR